MEDFAQSLQKTLVRFQSSEEERHEQEKNKKRILNFLLDYFERLPNSSFNLNNFMDFLSERMDLDGMDLSKQEIIHIIIQAIRKDQINISYFIVIEKQKIIQEMVGLIHLHGVNNLDSLLEQISIRHPFGRRLTLIDLVVFLKNNGYIS